jgi:CAAX prenyl protease-like protein
VIGAALPRVFPFAIYIAFLVIEQGMNAFTVGLDPRPLYPIKVTCVALALILFWRQYAELRGARAVTLSNWLYAFAVGVLIFVLWIVLDRPWAVFGKSDGWDPTGADGRTAWGLAAARVCGAALVVPVMEELFWRSFVMRWIRDHNFLTVDPRQVGGIALAVSSVLFAAEHHEWFAGLLAGLAYGWLYMRSGNLWPAIASHALTNLLLGVWVLYTREWQFW